MRDSHHPATIKTSAPSLDGTVERDRLVSALGKLPATARWLQAPSGTGKSTLAASYARSRKKLLAWYRLDERDNDPAFFYAEFAQALVAQLRIKELPTFSGDDHHRQQDFAHGFVASLIRRLAKPALIVLDDVQRVTSAEMQQALAGFAVAGVNGSEILFVSESSTPAAFFDAIAARQLALLNDADLRFDKDECRAMTAALRVDQAQSETIAALTGGHAGALVLACELLRGTDPKSALGVTTVERIHSHLLTKLVDRMPAARRALLLHTAFVEQLTRPIAAELAGIEAAAEIDALVDSGILRRVGSAVDETFEAHGLVQQGMRALALSGLGTAQAQDLAEKTATTLIANNQFEPAFTLLTQIGSTTRATALLQDLAERYAMHGQTDLLLNALAKVQEMPVQGNAWLCFWTGQALLRVDEGHARVWLARSYSAFESTGDALGMRLAAASIVTAFALEWADMQQLDLWIERHAVAGGDTPVAAAERFEANLLMGVVCAALVRGAYPQQIDADALITRMQLLLESPSMWLADDQRVQAATILIKHGQAFAKLELARTVIIATQSLVDASQAGALHRGRWLVAAAETLFASGVTARALEYLGNARSLAEQSQLHRLHFEVGFTTANHSMKLNDLQRADDELQRLERIVVQAPPVQRAEYARMRARLLLLQGHLHDGLRCAQEAVRMAAPAGLSGENLRMFEIELVYALAANDRLTEAIEIVSRQKYEPREVRLAMEHCLRSLQDGGVDAELLRTGLQYAREVNFVNLLDRARTPLVRLCAAALANNIETEFVLRLIKTKQLKPPFLAGPAWPWSVHVRTLGEFRLEIQGQPYRPSHKAQDKPLELLKLLVACQALARDAAEKTWIAERLWPDAEPENARKSLDMTIARLRRLLACEDSIVATEGKLQLSPTEVWTDIRPLLHAISSAQIRRDEHVAGIRPSSRDAVASVSSVLENYGGPFLADEEGPAWLLAGREAIATRVRQTLLTADTILDGGADAVLVPALQRALAADPTSEDLARALMRAHLRQGENGEAVRVYRRLREMLSLLLGIAPSPESEHIREQAYAANLGKTAVG